MPTNVVYVNGLIEDSGPIIRLDMLPPSVPGSQHRRKLNSLEVKALIDTGASITLLSQSVIKQFNIQAKGYTTVRGFGSAPLVCLLYPIEIIFKDGRGTLSMQCLVAEADLTSLKLQALLGRDILKQCELSYRGFVGEFNLTVIR